MDTAFRLPRGRLCVGDSGILVSQPSPLVKGGPRQQRSGALVNGVLETISPDLFHTTRTLSGSLRSPPSPRGEGFVSGIPLPPIQPPPLRGTSFHRKEGVVHASPFPWKGLPSAARRGWLSFLRRSRLLFAFPLGKGRPRSGARVLS